MVNDIRKKVSRNLKVRLKNFAAYNCFGALPLNRDAVDYLFFFDKIGLCYNRVQKNANTTVVSILCELNGLDFSSHTAAKIWCEQPPVSSLIRARHLHTCVVIRNPYSRLLSAFLQKFTFRRDTYVPRYGDFAPTPKGFSAFIGYLQRNGIDGNSHWDLQKKQIAYPLHCFDTVIRFEQFSKDMRDMLARLDIAPDMERLSGLGPTDIGKKTSADDKFYAFYGQEMLAAVREMYKEDFAFLNYDPDLPVMESPLRNSPRS